MNNDKVLESFISYCDDMKVGNEKLDTRILDLNFGKTMTLYHASDRDINGPIRPTSLNMGNRLNGTRVSSFWTRSIEESKFWAATWVPVYVNWNYDSIDVTRKKVVLPSFFKDKNNNDETLPDCIKRTCKDMKFYIYEAEVPIKHIGRGQAAIDEYTVDIPVKYSKKHVLSFSDIEKYIEFIDNEDKYYRFYNTNDSYKKKHLNLRERIIFKDSNIVKMERWKIMKDYSSNQ